MFELRSYQQEAVNKGIEFLNSDEKGGAIIVAPTGSGKSLIISSIAHALNGNTIVLQPSLEILESNLEKAKALGITDIGIYSASAGRKDIGKLTFGTIGSVINKKELFEGFDHLIIDECHLVGAKGGMYQEFIDHLGGKCLGLTATPYRLHAYGDFKSGDLVVVAKFLHRTRPRIFKKIIHITQIQELYTQKFLCPIEYLVSDKYEQSKIKLNSTGMNFDEDSLAKYNEEVNLVELAKKCVLGEKSEHILVFMSSVAEASKLSENLIASGISAAIVSAKTPKRERAEILRKFKEGEIRVVTNFGTLTVGYDFPALACCILARPTQSISLFYQMIGRILRISPGKEKARLIDLCSSVKRFGRIEHFEIIEPKKGLHRLKSDRSYLTEFDFYHNVDMAERGYGDMKETVYKKRGETMMFGKYKGTHVSKLPNQYIQWGLKTFTGNVQKMLQNELNRRNAKPLNIKKEESLPF